MKNLDNQTITKSEVSALAQELIKLLPHKQIFTFSGPLGAGKTTLVQEMLRQLGVTDPITSPTYTYVNIYRLPDGRTFYHFDLYRLTHLREFIDAGFDEYLYQASAWSFIEWPEIIQTLLKERAVGCKLEYAPAGDTRVISVKLD